jgi:flagellar basal body-associated protein FliL
MDTHVVAAPEPVKVPEAKKIKSIKFTKNSSLLIIIMVGVWLVLAGAGFAGGYYGYNSKHKKPSINDKLVYSKLEAAAAAKKTAELKAQKQAQLAEYVKKAGTETNATTKSMDYIYAAFLADDLKDASAKSLANSALQNITASKTPIPASSGYIARLKTIAGVK